jgi:hypothetical protein
LSFNGTSAVRRTGNLTIVATEENNDLKNLDNLISMNKEIILEVGLKNTFPEDEKYQNFPILWFP